MEINNKYQYKNLGFGHEIRFPDYVKKIINILLNS